MRTVAIVQARHDSNRLPGKVLHELAGRPMLDRVLSRVRRAKSVSETVLATSVSSADDLVADLGTRLGVRTIRGSEHDVLARYALAVRETSADVVVRITADCPVIDPKLIDDVVRAFVDAQEQRWDFAANTLERTYPRGLDVEVTHREALLVAEREATETYERAHVMPFLYRRPERFRLCSVRGDEDLSRHRWTVDTPEDMTLAQAIYQAFAGEDSFGWRDVLSLLEARPELSRVNADVTQKPLDQG